MRYVLFTTAVVTAAAAIAACGGGDSKPAQTSTAAKSTRPTVTPYATASPTSAPSFRASFQSIYFIDSMHGWVGGLAGSGQNVIFATSDGGATWTKQYSGGEGSVEELNFVSQRIGWAAAQTQGNKPGFTLLHTTDAGKTWFSIYSATERLSSIEFLDADIGRAIAGEFEPQLVETTDGGRTWTQLPGLTKPTSVCFDDFDSGWAAGDSKVFHTTDGGRSWTLTFEAPADLEGGPTGSGLGAGPVWCAGRDVVWALFLDGTASSQTGYVLYRTLDGTQWDPVMSYGFPQLQVPEHGAKPGPFAVAGEGSAYFLPTCSPCNQGHVDIEKTEDNGRTWQSPGSIPVDDFADVIACPDVSHCWMAGQQSVETGALRAVILATADGGQTWTQQYP
jgi:photosystem II stability/assembly factor-like uncharacterized protein